MKILNKGKKTPPPDFKNKELSPLSAEYEEFSLADLQDIVKTKIDFIEGKANLIASEFSLPVNERKSDKNNIIMLAGLRDDALNVQIVIEWLFENFKVVPIENDE